MVRVKTGSIKVEFDQKLGRFVFYRSGNVGFTMGPGEAMDLFKALILLQEKYGEDQDNKGYGDAGLEQPQAPSDGDSAL
jgi:hypothetical protein